MSGQARRKGGTARLGEVAGPAVAEVVAVVEGTLATEGVVEPPQPATAPVSPARQMTSPAARAFTGPPGVARGPPLLA